MKTLVSISACLLQLGLLVASVEPVFAESATDEEATIPGEVVNDKGDTTDKESTMDLESAMDRESIIEMASTVDHEAWRTVNRCGANSLYTFLKMNNASVSYDHLVRELEANLQGVTLKDLRDAAENRGVDCRVVKATPESLLSMELPVIAHFHVIEDMGHYVVVVAANDRRITTIDGTTAKISQWEPQKFHERWSGYLLVTAGGQTWTNFLWVGAAAALLIAVTFNTFKTRRVKT